MGNENTKTQLQINPDQWQYLSKENQISIVRDHARDRNGQQQVILMNSKSTFERQVSIYKTKRNNDKALVDVYGVMTIESQYKTFCGNQQSFKVITQRIPHRWNQLPQLTLPENLYALNQALKGYNQLFKKIGTFSITQKMIGLNQYGEVKVWLNQNFAVNTPDHQRPVLQTVAGTNQYKQLFQVNKDQEDMVRNVLNIIQQKCEEGRYPQQLRHNLHLSKKFVNAQKQIELFCERNRLFIPSKIYIETVPNSQVQTLLQSQSIMKQQSQHPQPPQQLVIQPPTNLNPSISKKTNFYAQSHARQMPNFMYQQQNSIKHPLSYQGYQYQDSVITTNNNIQPYAYSATYQQFPQPTQTIYQNQLSNQYQQSIYQQQVSSPRSTHTNIQFMYNSNKTNFNNTKSNKNLTKYAGSQVQKIF